MNATLPPHSLCLESPIRGFCCAPPGCRASHRSRLDEPWHCFGCRPCCFRRARRARERACHRPARHENVHPSVCHESVLAALLKTPPFADSCCNGHAESSASHTRYKPVCEAAFPRIESCAADVLRLLALRRPSCSTAANLLHERGVPSVGCALFPAAAATWLGTHALPPSSGSDLRSAVRYPARRHSRTLHPTAHLLQSAKTAKLTQSVAHSLALSPAFALTQSKGMPQRTLGGSRLGGLRVRTHSRIWASRTFARPSSWFPSLKPVPLAGREKESPFVCPPAFLPGGALSKHRAAGGRESPETCGEGANRAVAFTLLVQF